MDNRWVGWIGTCVFLGIYGVSCVSTPLLYLVTEESLARHWTAGAGLPTDGYRIFNDAMIPTLGREDCFISVNSFESLVPGDIVFYTIPSGGGLKDVKRVVGLPGDRVEYRDKALYINGTKIRQEMLDGDAGRGIEGVPRDSIVSMEYLVDAEAEEREKVGKRSSLQTLMYSSVAADHSDLYPWSNPASCPSRSVFPTTSWTRQIKSLKTANGSSRKIITFCWGITGLPVLIAAIGEACPRPILSAPCLLYSAIVIISDIVIP